MTEEQIFSTALELTEGSARAAYLDRVCGSDQQLRRQVESLLRSHSMSGNFLNEPLVSLRKPDWAKPASDATLPEAALGGFAMKSKSTDVGSDKTIEHSGDEASPEEQAADPEHAAALGER